MSTTLNADMNIVSRSGIEIQLLDGDLNIIQKLDDEPNDVGGLTSAQLKEKFDEAGNTIKTFLNESLIPEILAADATEAAREAAEQDRAAAEVERASAEQARVEAENGRVSAEADRVTAEQGRAAAEQARADENDGIVARATAQAEAAAASASQAEGYKASAQRYAGDAEYYASNMRNEVIRAAAYASDANKSATAAGVSETAAKASETAAAASADAAAASAARAEEISGGDFATKTELGAHTGNADIHVTASEKAALDGKAEKAKCVSITLSASGWDSTAKTQTVTVTGVSATETAQLITPVPALASQAAYYDAGIKCTGQAANSLTFTADTVPTADLTVYVTIQEVSA